MAQINTGTAAPVLEVDNVTKTFPGVVANDNVSLTLNEGEIHCLLGENGAGKSTLVNMVFGLYQPDKGTIRVHGKETRFTDSGDAIAKGIGMVHQHFQLIPVFTVTENIILGNEITKGTLLDFNTARRQVLAIAERYGLAVDPDATVGDLSVGEQQRVELVKALFRDANILILDEPTAVLTPGEVDDFFSVVRNLTQQGKSIIFITHKLREVLAVADRITVLRSGKVVGNTTAKRATQQSLANLMVGRDVVFRVEKTTTNTSTTALQTRGLRVQDNRGVQAVTDLDLEVRTREILGIAGVEGNGQRELVEAICGMRPPNGGTVQMLGHETTAWSPRRIKQLGVAHIPENRSKHGVVAQYSIADNLVLNRYTHNKFSKRGVLNRSAINTEAVALIEQFDVRATGVTAALDTLSGGNQQKVVVARELSGNPQILVVAQPTRGLDVGSIEFIHRKIIELRDRGVAVLLVSAELDEIMALSDRIGVLYRGRLAAIVDAADTTREKLGLLMATGSTTHPPQAQQ
ncbi:MAG: ABC transporter ATP-binding protein [Acidimicrobiia bacterium]|nr:ABC transporter ATP-binding protein [Acidimicrobiia bacterium]MYC57749.1 ABC transporter ATP-binding protein [Acidimicrobiia bacterium]MYG93432.1 ABC transporter ATP-binding protein [Acidimicrobiia bacterium]MYI31298.1 ABC transporter ATP-binding protein [Acidimicrobiia bacterium]